MKVTCEVTFEFLLRPPESWKGEIEGYCIATITRRAVDWAQKELKPRNWISMSCVVRTRT